MFIHTWVCTQYAGGWRLNLMAKSNTRSLCKSEGLEHIENPPIVSMDGILKSTLQHELILYLLQFI